MAILRLFAMAREAAGTKPDVVDAPTVGEVLEIARDRYGPEFASILAVSRVRLNGEPASGGAAARGCDEVAVLPPVSGG